MYKTYDLLIAATLVYKDYDCSIKKDSVGERCAFIFEIDEHDSEDISGIKMIVDEYWKGKMLVEPKKFNSITRELKARTKEINE